MQRPADVHTTFATEVTSRFPEKSTAGMVRLGSEQGHFTPRINLDLGGSRRAKSGWNLALRFTPIA